MVTLLVFSDVVFTMLFVSIETNNLLRYIDDIVCGGHKGDEKDIR